MDVPENVSFVFQLLDDINKAIRDKTNPSNEGYDYLSLTEVQNIVAARFKIKDPRLTNHGQRIAHFMLYLNVENENCGVLKTDPTLNLHKYIHGKPISRNTYYKVVDVLKLKPFVTETIMCTPYAFCRDLISIALHQIKALDGISQLKSTENLIISLLKCIKRSLVQPDLESALSSHFNQIMLVFGKDYVPHDVRRFDYDDDQKEVAKYNGFRLKCIFKICLEIIKYKIKPDFYRAYPMYKLKSIRFLESGTSFLFDKFYDVVLHKCVNMCDFTIETWLSWFEVEVVEDDTNLQSSIGHICQEICDLIDNENLIEPIFDNFMPVLRNLSIKKVDFSNVNTSDIDALIECAKKSPKHHISDWIKKLMQHHDMFSHSQALVTLERSIENVDMNCFKSFIDQFTAHYRSGGELSEIIGDVLYKGLRQFGAEDKLAILKYSIDFYPDNSFILSKNYDQVLHSIAHDEFKDDVDNEIILSKLVWLVIQQPKKMLHTLISQYVYGICGLPPKGIDAKRTCFHQVLVILHVHMDSNCVYEEYSSWLDGKLKFSAQESYNLRQWILGITRMLRFMRPKLFLANVIVPLLNPSPDFKHMMFMINLTKFFLNECQLMTLPDIDAWDKILIQLAKLLDHARWNIKDYSHARVDLCEKIIMTLQPLLHYATFVVKPEDLESIKQELSNLQLITRCHFLCLWTTNFITIDGMDEQFIMTIQSNSHISYSNLNRSSTQGVQEEFIFSIAANMPKFTLHEMKSFIANYLSTAKLTNLFDASFFLMDCQMNAVMRIIVYLKTAGYNEPCSNECAWDYLENTIINIFDAVNASKMCCIYDEEIDVNVAFASVTKIIMVVKQLEDTRQVALMIVLRRIINIMIRRLEADSMAKLITMLAPIKTKNFKDILESTVNALVDKLTDLTRPNLESTQNSTF